MVVQKNFRLTKSSDFANIRKNGKARSNSELVLIMRLNNIVEPSVVSRFGFVVSKRIGNAVVRNKCKRHMKEAIRKLEIENGYDLVFIARSPIKGKNFQEISKSMKQLLLRSKLIIY